MAPTPQDKRGVMDYFDELGKRARRAARDLLDGDGRAREAQTSQGIRLMTPHDLDEVLRIIRLHDSDDYHSARHAFSPERFTLSQEVTAHFVLEDFEERRIVGVSGYFIDDDEAQGIYWLGWTYVNPFFRGRGFGKVLMRHVEERLLGLGARKLYLSTSSLEKYASAVRFYERCGFATEATLSDYFRPGEHKLLMAKSLSSQALTHTPLRPAPRATPASRAPDTAPRAASGAQRLEEDSEEPTVFEF